MKPFDIIATVSPRVVTDEFLHGFVERGVTTLRINGAHADPPEARRLIGLIRGSIGREAQVLIDLPGSKIRTANLATPIPLYGGEPFTLEATQFNYPGFLSYLRPGQVLLASDGKLQFVVDACDANRVSLTPRFTGVLENNKGVHIVGAHPEGLPFLFERDHALIEVAKESGAELVGLSFVRGPEDVRQARRLLEGSGVDAICKIETPEACKRLADILPLTARVLVDRGDLAAGIGIYRLPSMERAVAKQAARRGVKVYVATQILFNMVEHPTPLMAEVASLHEVLGYADGLQFSEETSIGKYPLEVLEVVQQMRVQVADVEGAADVRRGDPEALGQRSGVEAG